MTTNSKIRKMLATTVAAGALLGGSLGLAAATSASALTPPAVDLGDFEIDPCVFEPGGCGGVDPMDPIGPDDIGIPEDECDLAPQFCDNPDDLTTPEYPPTTHPEEDPDPEVNPDVVVARPNFTG